MVASFSDIMKYQWLVQNKFHENSNWMAWFVWFNWVIGFIIMYTVSQEGWLQWEEKKCCLLESKWKIKYDLLRCNDVMLTLGVCVLVVLQMVDMVISMIVMFPKGAPWNLRNVYGSPRHTRYDIGKQLICRCPVRTSLQNTTVIWCQPSTMSCCVFSSCCVFCHQISQNHWRSRSANFRFSSWDI